MLEQAGRGGPEPSTDPGGTYEGLYRASASSPGSVLGPGAGDATPGRRLPQYRPALTPPDDAGDTFGWLFRDDGARQPSEVAHVAEVGSTTVSRPRFPVSEPHQEPPSPPQATLPYPAPVGPDRRRRGVVVVLAGLIVVLLIALVVVAGTIVLRQRARTIAAAPSAGSSQSLAGDPTRAGSASALLPGPSVPSAGAADCQAPPATDDGGRQVNYLPEQTYDGDPSTAWRCDGTGRDQTLTFTFPAGTTISELGVLNGYAKVDPSSGKHRYGEYRRITLVRWTFPGGDVYAQNLDDGNETVQVLQIPPHQADEVQLTILDSTSPGSKAKTRDAVLISEVSFTG